MFLFQLYSSKHSFYPSHVCTCLKSHHVCVAVFSHSSADHIKLSRAAGHRGGADGQQQRCHRLPHILKHAETLHAAQPLLSIKTSYSIQLQTQLHPHVSVNKSSDLGIAQSKDCVWCGADLSTKRGHLVSPSSLQQATNSNPLVQLSHEAPHLWAVQLPTCTHTQQTHAGHFIQYTLHFLHQDRGCYQLLHDRKNRYR